MQSTSLPCSYENTTIISIQHVVSSMLAADLWYAIWVEWSGSKEGELPLDHIFSQIDQCTYCRRKKHKWQRPEVLTFLLAIVISWPSTLSESKIRFSYRFMGIFKFVYEDVFGPFPQRAYADPQEKWELALACLEHFRMWVVCEFFCLKIIAFFLFGMGNHGMWTLDPDIPFYLG